MKQHIYYLLSAIFFCCLSNIQAQELVPNSEFENYKECPAYYTQYSASSFLKKLIPGWTYPTWGTPDYFNRCSDNIDCSVPENSNGVSEPHSGDGYIGLFLKPTPPNGYIEYVDTKLAERLKPGVKYCISLYYKLSTYSYWAVDDLGIYLTGSRVQENNPAQLSFPAQVANPEGNFLTNKDEWKELCSTYIANGDETFLIIGNFSKDKISYKVVDDTTMIPPRTYKYAYYYIDDVSIKELTNCLECNCVPHDLQVNAQSNFSADLNADVTDGSIKLNIKGGTKPYNILWSDGSTGTELKNLGEGTYSYTVTDDNNCIYSNSVSFTGPLRAFHESEYKGEETGWIDVTAKGGVPPYKFTWDDGAEGKKRTNLGVGQYNYTVTDMAGNKVKGTETFDEFTAAISNVLEGEALVLENIYFDFDKTDLLPKSYVELNKVVDYMQKYDVKQVEISGHTDSKGSDDYNQKLSEARAKSVVEYLTFRGIDKERLQYVGFGEVKPIDTNQTDEGRARNRRVEFKVNKL